MGLREKLSKYSILGLDTSVFIYHLEAHPDYLALTQEIFTWVTSGQKQAVTSAITLMEINVRPLQLGRKDIARQYEALLVNLPNLTIVPVDRDVACKAASLRAEFKVRPADALQVAACLDHGAQVFVTNDHHLTILNPVIDVLVLDILKP